MNSELDQLRRQYAAMREALELCEKTLCAGPCFDGRALAIAAAQSALDPYAGRCSICEGGNPWHDTPHSPIFQPDAGSKLLSPEEVKPLQDAAEAAQALLDCIEYPPPGSGSVGYVFIPTMRIVEARQAIARCKSLGLLQ